MTEVGEHEAQKPFVAECRRLQWHAPIGWIKAGWQDLKRAPRVSLTYGLIMVALSYMISIATWYLGNMGLYLGVLSGFVFLGPVLALTLYAVSARLALGAPISVRRTWRDAWSALGDAMIFALILLVVFLIWARSAAMVHIFFPVGSKPGLAEWVTFLGIGSSIGACFCALIFTASAFSLPMMLDREADTVTAVVTSINATLRNKRAMMVWAACIGVCLLLGLLTAYLAFAVLLPLLGHAAWHGYRETVDASAWPSRPLS